jgi:pentatricopeptide repeat-containing protein PET309
MDHLARSQRFIDVERAISLLEEVDPDKRTADDYSSVIVSLFSAGHTSTVYQLCETALTQQTKVDAFAIVFKISITEKRWQDTLGFWRKGHDKFDYKSFGSLASLQDFPQCVLSLLEYMKTMKDLDAKLLDVLLTTVFQSKDAMADIRLETLLSLTREFSDLGIITQEHYELGIKTLIKVGTRSSFVAAMVLYRNFRWHLSTCVPPTYILHGLLETLVELGNYRGVQYLLNDFIHFHRKPSVEAYKIALTVFSRRADSDKVKELFDDLLRNHGAPSLRHPDYPRLPRHIKWVVPVIHSYALVGDYPRAIEEFNKIMPIYRLRPNSVAWNALISAPANANNLKKAFRIFRRMRLKGIKPNQYTYAILMNLCARLGNVKAVLALSQMAQESNVGLSTYLIYPVVDAYCRSQFLDEAEQMAESSMSLELSGSRTILWDRLLWAHAFRADMDSVSRIHKRMKEARLQFTENTYAAMMLSFCIVGRPDSARRLLRGLQRGGKIHASEFLYTIVLYGFVKQGNRDMVYIIYKEMIARFGNPGMSTRLLMLRHTIGRDTLKGVGTGDSSDSRLAMSEDYLFRAVFDFEKTDFAKKSPRPGTSSLPISQAFPSLYYEPVLKAYSMEGLHGRNEKLLAEYRLDVEAAKASGKPTVTPSLRFLSVLMQVYLLAGKLEMVGEFWKMAKQRALEVSRGVNIESLAINKRQPALATDSTAGLDKQQQSSLPESAIVLDSTTAPVEHTTPRGPFYLDRELVPAQAYILSRHLSLYMRALGENGQTDQLPELVKKHIRRGYSLTSANWLTYVRTLAASPLASEQTDAFVTFERIFMPAFPGWRRLRRGAQLRPPDVPRTIDLLDSRRTNDPETLEKAGARLWTKLDPTWTRPTYNVMIYLGAALRDFKRRSLHVGTEEMDTLYNAAPQTLEALAAMPHWREKYQGVLLRDQPERIDPAKKSGDPYVWTGGILGVDGHVRPKLRNAAEHARYELSELEATLPSPQSDLADAQEPPQSEDGSEANDYDPAEIDDRERAQAPEDEHDIELETTIELQRRNLGVDSVRNETLRDQKK